MVAKSKYDNRNLKFKMANIICKSNIEKIFHVCKNEYPKVLRVAVSKSHHSISKFKMADPIWQIKSLKIVVFL